ncbi:MAG: hypothetical protein NTV87_05695 [Ignavibacteriae bacterium]|nr:hypothetical protein [Ignavibacteriota bacterium]
MKKLIFLFLFLIISYSVYAQRNRDTTLTANFSPADKEQKISVSIRCKDEKLSFSKITYTISIGGKNFVDTIYTYADGTDIKLIDIDKNDGYKELLFMFYTGYADEYEYRVYKITDVPLLISKDLFFNTFVPDGKGSVTAEYYTGFTVITDILKLSKDGNKLERVESDYYPIDIDATVTNPFDLLSERNNDSKVVTRTKKNEKIKLTGYDLKRINVLEKEVRKIKGIEKTEEVEHSYNWFKIETSDKKSGWLFAEPCNFDKFFEGVNCAD